MTLVCPFFNQWRTVVQTYGILLPLMLNSVPSFYAVSCSFECAIILSSERIDKREVQTYTMISELYRQRLLENPGFRQQCLKSQPPYYHELAQLFYITVEPLIFNPGRTRLWSKHVTSRIIRTAYKQIIVEKHAYIK